MQNSIKLSGEFQPNLYLDFCDGTIYSNKNAEAFIDLQNSTKLSNTDDPTKGHQLADGYYFYINDVIYYPLIIESDYYISNKNNVYYLDMYRDIYDGNISLSIPEDKKLTNIPVPPQFLQLDDKSGYNFKISSGWELAEITKILIDNGTYIHPFTKEGTAVHEIDRDPYGFDLNRTVATDFYLEFSQEKSKEELEEIISTGLKNIKDGKFYPFYIYLNIVKIENGIIEKNNNGRINNYADSSCEFGNYFDNGEFQWNTRYNDLNTISRRRFYCMPLYAPSLNLETEQSTDPEPLVNKVIKLKQNKKINKSSEGQLYTIVYPKMSVKRDDMETEDSDLNRSIVLCADSRLFNPYSYKTVQHSDPDLEDDYVQVIYCPEGEDHTSYDANKTYDTAQKCFFQVGPNITKFLLLAPGSIVTFSTIIYTETLSNGKTEDVIYWVVKNPDQFTEFECYKYLSTCVADFTVDEDNNLQYHNDTDKSSKYIDEVLIDKRTGLFVSKTLKNEIDECISKYNKDYYPPLNPPLNGKLCLYIDYKDSNYVDGSYYGEVFDEKFKDYNYVMKFYIQDKEERDDYIDYSKTIWYNTASLY